MIHIICLGNLWQGDDGIGIHVYQKLMSRDLPGFVKVFDGGIMGFGALNYFENCRMVIVVDALEFSEKEGKIHSIKVGEFSTFFSGDWSQEEDEERYTSHNLDINYLLRILPIVFENRKPPEIVIFGIEIKRIKKYSNTLSPPLNQALEQVIELINLEIQQKQHLNNPLVE